MARRSGWTPPRDRGTARPSPAARRRRRRLLRAAGALLREERGRFVLRAVRPPPGLEDCAGVAGRPPAAPGSSRRPPAGGYVSLDVFFALSCYLRESVTDPYSTKEIIGAVVSLPSWWASTARSSSPSTSALPSHPWPARWGTTAAGTSTARSSSPSTSATGPAGGAPSALLAIRDARVVDRFLAQCERAVCEHFDGLVCEMGAEEVQGDELTASLLGTCEYDIKTEAELEEVLSAIHTVVKGFIQKGILVVADADGYLLRKTDEWPAG